MSSVSICLCSLWGTHDIVIININDCNLTLSLCVEHHKAESKSVSNRNILWMTFLWQSSKAAEQVLKVFYFVYNYRLVFFSNKGCPLLNVLMKECNKSSTSFNMLLYSTMFHRHTYIPYRVFIK